MVGEIILDKSLSVSNIKLERVRKDKEEKFNEVLDKSNILFEDEISIKGRKILFEENSQLSFILDYILPIRKKSLLLSEFRLNYNRFVETDKDRFNFEVDNGIITIKGRRRKYKHQEVKVGKLVYKFFMENKKLIINYRVELYELEDTMAKYRVG